MPNLVAGLTEEVRQRYPTATVEGRGRRHVRFRLPNAPDGRQRYALAATIGSLHYGPAEDQEINTDWVPVATAWQYEMALADYTASARSVLNSGDLVQYAVGGESVTFQPLALNWVNQDNSRQQIALPQAVAAEATGDVLYWPNGYGPGRHFRYQTHGTRLDKRLILDTPAALPAPTVTGTVWLELEFIIKNTAGVELYLDGVKWARTNNVRVRTAGRIEFRQLSTGNVLWQMDYPRAVDAEDNVAIGQFEVRRQGGGYYLTVRIPKPWVDSAVFPVALDPTLDLQVGTSTDDATNVQNNTIGAATGMTGLLNVYSSTASQPSGNGRDTGARFTNVTIPAGATIDVAYAELYCPNTSRDDLECDVYLNDVDDAVTFDDAESLWNRVRTTASVSIVIAAGGTGWHGSAYSLVSAVQEVVDRAGWASGQDMAVLWIGKGNQAAQAVFRANAYDNSPSTAPRLHVVYTEASGGTAYERSVADSVGLSDLRSQLGTFSRTVADSLGVTEVLSQAGVFSRILAEGVGIADVVSRAGFFPRTLADGVGVSDLLSRVRMGVFSRTVSDGVGLSDLQSRVGTFYRTLSEQVGLSDIRSQVGTFIRTLSEQVAVSDLWSQVGTFLRTLSEQVGISDSTPRSLETARSVADGVGVSDVPSWAAILLRSIADSVALSDGAFGQSALSRAVAEGVGVTDAQVREGKIYRTLSEGLGVSDAVLRSLGMTRSSLDSVAASDSAYSLLVGLERSLSDGVGVTDSADQVGTFLRSLAEAVGITDETGRAAYFSRTVEEDVALSDVVSRQLNPIPVIDAARALWRWIGIKISTGI